MILKFGNKKIELDVKKLPGSISKSTGIEIEKIAFNIELRGIKEKDNFRNVLKKSKKNNICSINEEGKIIKRFKVFKSSYKYSGTNIDEETIFNFSIELEEVEELKIESLIISGIEFSAYEYSERFYDKSLMIYAKIKLTSNEINKLIIEKYSKNEIYFPVIRKGINDEEKIMRFGQTFWSLTNGDYKFDLTLVEKSYDESEKKFKSHFGSKELNVEKFLAYNNNYLDELIKLLISKKLLSNKEVELIKNKANDNVEERIRDFYKVNDID